MKQHCISLFFILLCFQSFGQKKIERYDNGNKKYEEEQKNGYFVGERIWYYENGNKKSEAIYDMNGVLIGHKQWDENGQVITDRNLRDEQKRKGKTDLSNIRWTKFEFVDEKCKIGYSFIENGIDSLPTNGDTVVLNYIGYFENGEQFDNSIDNKSPLEFVVGNNVLLASFANSIVKFKKGGKGYIKIPPEVAYGEKPSGNIPANSTLIYYVEIIDVRK